MARYNLIVKTEIFTGLILISKETGVSIGKLINMLLEALVKHYFKGSKNLVRAIEKTVKEGLEELEIRKHLVEEHEARNNNTFGGERYFGVAKAQERPEAVDN